MTDSASGAKTNRTPALFILGITFLILKLTGFISSWPWIWVLAPFWIMPAIAIVVFTVAFIVALTAHVITNTNK